MGMCKREPKNDVTSAKRYTNKDISRTRIRFLSRRNPTHLVLPTFSFLHVLIVKEGNRNSNLGNLCDPLRWSSPPAGNIVHAMGRDGRPAAAATGARSWISMDCTGRGIVLDVDKHEIMRRAQIHARDMRIIDPLLSYPSAILGREKAIVLNLEVSPQTSSRIFMLFMFDANAIVCFSYL